MNIILIIVLNVFEITALLAAVCARCALQERLENDEYFSCDVFQKAGIRSQDIFIVHASCLYRTASDPRRKFCTLCDFNVRIYSGFCRRL